MCVAGTIDLFITSKENKRTRVRTTSNGKLGNGIRQVRDKMSYDVAGRCWETREKRKRFIDEPSIYE